MPWQQARQERQQRLYGLTQCIGTPRCIGVGWNSGPIYWLNSIWCMHTVPRPPALRSPPAPVRASRTGDLRPSVGVAGAAGCTFAAAAASTNICQVKLENVASVSVAPGPHPYM